MRFWRNTNIANLAAGTTATLPFGTLGYEWDEDLDNGSRPAGLIRMSTTTVSNAPVLTDFGSTFGSGTATHHLTLYRASSGALVFGSGTVQWAWGLDSNHDLGSSAPDSRMQQATVNLFADMSVQPATLQSGLVAATASTDTTAPTSTITSPNDGANLPLGTPATVTGTASDTGGGVVGGVEVSVDGGSTWHPATGRANWSYTWTPLGSGPVTVRSRAADDSGNLETPGPGVTVDRRGERQHSADGPGVHRAGRCSTRLTAPVTWAFGDPAVATIAATGVATGVSAGTATITATLDGVTSDPATRRSRRPRQSIAVTPASASITAGGTQAFSATGTYSDSSTQDLTAQVTWASGDPAVATIAASGGATGVSAGATTISASLGAVVSNDATLTVTAATGSGVCATLAVSGTVRRPVGEPECFGHGRGRYRGVRHPVQFLGWHGDPGVLADPDTSPVELGVKFRSAVDGFITGLRFYKSTQNTGTHVANLWTSTGTLLASATFSNETGSGWQEVSFGSPVAITADTVYVASYHAPVGRYSVDEDYFVSARTNGPLTALATSESSNGVYLYGAGGFPTNSFKASNYWVDVVMTTSLAPDETPP